MFKRNVVYNTFKEMYENRPNKLPFIFSADPQYPQPNEGKYTIECIPIDKSNCRLQVLEGKFHKPENKVDEKKLVCPITTVAWYNCKIVDWFSTKKNIGICTCDFYSVIMISGCKCGGK